MGGVGDLYMGFPSTSSNIIQIFTLNMKGSIERLNFYALILWQASILCLLHGSCHAFHCEFYFHVSMIDLSVELASVMCYWKRYSFCF